MKSVDFDEGKRLEETQRCAVCGGRVTLAWGGALGELGWVVRCARIRPPGPGAAGGAIRSGGTRDENTERTGERDGRENREREDGGADDA